MAYCIFSYTLRDDIIQIEIFSLGFEGELEKLFIQRKWYFADSGNDLSALYPKGSERVFVIGQVAHFFWKMI